jgi:type III secretion protein J
MTERWSDDHRRTEPGRRGAAVWGLGASVSPGRRGGRNRAARPILAVVLVALALAGCKTDLYTKLNEREANEMVALLLGHGIDAGRTVAKDGSSIVQVDEKRLAQAIELLRASGFPRQSFTNMGEVFKGSGLIASPTEERARFIYALSEELSRTVSDIDGVLSARIHVVLPKNDLLRQDTTPSSASVFIRHDARAPLKNLLPQIKMLVANSIEGLSYEKVSVVLVPVDRSEALGGTLSPAAVAGHATAATATAARSTAVSGDAALPIAGGVALVGVAGAAFWLGRRRSAAAAAPPRAAADLAADQGALAASPAVARLANRQDGRAAPRQVA